MQHLNHFPMNLARPRCSARHLAVAVALVASIVGMGAVAPGGANTGVDPSRCQFEVGYLPACALTPGRADGWYSPGDSNAGAKPVREFTVPANVR